MLGFLLSSLSAFPNPSEVRETHAHTINDMFRTMSKLQAKCHA